jgi:hypothetical protein
MFPIYMKEPKLNERVHVMHDEDILHYYLLAKTQLAQLAQL